MNTSQLTKGNHVTFPQFTGERVYMQKFYKETGLPTHLNHWQETVDSMLDGINTDQPIFIMVDQSIVKSNTSHRRPGPHIDGYWIEASNSHGGGGRHSSISTGSHSSQPIHLMNANGQWESGGWNSIDLSTPESIILASNYSSCKGYIGDWEGDLGDGGDCSNVDLSNLEQIMLESNIAYRGNVGFIHESLPVKKEVFRTLVRLNLKGV